MQQFIPTATDHVPHGGQAMSEASDVQKWKVLALPLSGSHCNGRDNRNGISGPCHPFHTPSLFVKWAKEMMNNATQAKSHNPYFYSMWGTPNGIKWLNSPPQSYFKCLFSLEGRHRNTECRMQKEGTQNAATKFADLMVGRQTPWARQTWFLKCVLSICLCKGCDLTDSYTKNPKEATSARAYLEKQQHETKGGSQQNLGGEM